MKALSSHSEFPRARARSLVEAENFDECLLVFGELAEVRPLHPQELVQYSRCMQLGTGAVGTLEEAEELLRKALEIEEGYVPALLEMGWFLHAVRDQSEQALPYFERALREITALAEEAGRGKQECLAELSAAESDE
jgi:tetratricopeptide (TPR) repeat protein